MPKVLFKGKKNRFFKWTQILRRYYFLVREELNFGMRETDVVKERKEKGPREKERERERERIKREKEREPYDALEFHWKI